MDFWLYRSCLHCPPGEVERFASLGELLVEFVGPFLNAHVEERFHFLDVCEGILPAVSFIVRAFLRMHHSVPVRQRVF